MLTILLPATPELKAASLQLEHSLVSLSKWEAIHEKPFFGNEAKDTSESLSYIEQMLLSEKPHEGYLTRIEPDDMAAVATYINSRQSATTFNEEPATKGGPQKIITGEVIYHWMMQLEIPFKPCDEWPLQRLMNLIKIAGIHNAPPKKMSKEAQAQQMRDLNAKRLKELGTTG